MPRTFLAAAVIALAACSEPPPPPAPVAAPSVEPAKPEPKEQVKAPEAPKPEPKADPNAELATRVKRALEGEAKVQAAAIDVTATDGKVTLWGTAASAGERSRAGQVAGKVEGVKAVDNQLKVVRGS